MINANKWKLIGDITATGALDFLGGLRQAGKSAQTYNHYLKAAKQFTRWIVRDRRSPTDPLAHLSKLNVRTDRRHDRRALAPDEFERLIAAAENGPTIRMITGPDRAMMYVLAAWTGFRKGEIGSLTLRSFQFDDDPPTATVAASYSKRKREDTQILHPHVVLLLREWLATKPNVEAVDLLFPVSGKVPGGKERPTHTMMQRDLKSARSKWIEESGTDAERHSREKADFLKYCDSDGLFADFHSNRHMFITSLEHASVSPKMAQTLARHSDVRLTLGVYTHIGRHDQSAAIESLPAPPGSNEGPGIQAEVVKATGTHDATANGGSVVPTMVASGAQNGAVLPASKQLQIASTCTDERKAEVDDVVKTDTPKSIEDGTLRTGSHQSALVCTDQMGRSSKVSPRGFEPLTFGFGGRRAIQLCHGDAHEITTAG